MQSKDPEQAIRYQELARKWRNGTITPEEEKEFSGWYDQLQDAPVSIPADFASSEADLRNRILDRINKSRATKAPAMRLFVRLAAAVVVTAVATSIFFLMPPAGRIKPAVRQTAPQAEPVSQHHATLTLNDGSQIALDAAGNGVLSQQGNTRIVKLANGQVAYQLHPHQQRAATVAFNTISTPRGELYQLTLPDQTKVWLNASSSLRFPTTFAGGTRQVELKGEAYFEVSKNLSQPFVVCTDQMQVQVLGTHFNVMAYKEEEETRTTLLEGSVKLLKGSSQALLQPGQQGNLSGGTFQVRKDVNLEEVMAWKNGAFYFQDTRLEAIMRQIERWYDVSVQYRSPVSGINLSGNISHTRDVRELLEILEATHQVKFTFNGHHILVSRYVGNGPHSNE